MSSHWVLDHLRDVPDFPTPGIVFKDITPLLGDSSAFARLIDELVAPHADSNVTHVAGIEARGFVLAAPMALRLGAGLVPIRKAGKLPHDTVSASYALEYGKDSLEVHADAVPEGGRVLLIDDVLATGGTARAAASILGQIGADLVGIGFLLELAFLGGRANLDQYDVTSLAVLD